MAINIRAFNILRKSFILKSTCRSSTSRLFSEWHLVGALCLERKPVIGQPLSPLQARYWDLMQRLEVEKSLLSDHEMRQKEDKRIGDKMKKGDMEEVDSVQQQTAADFEDVSLEQYNTFQPAPNTTDADLSGDRRSVLRKLDTSLVLVVQQRLGNDLQWLLPHAIHQQGETLVQSAVRSVVEMCPSLGQLRLMGNAPVGFYKYKYPKLLRGDGICGAKVFFFKAQLVGLQRPVVVEPTENVLEHAWVTHAELSGMLAPPYAKAVNSFLLPDTFTEEELSSATDHV